MALSPAFLRWEEQTLNEGIRLGREQGIYLVVCNLLKIGMSPEQVAELTDLSLGQVQQISSSGHSYGANKDLD